MRHSSCSAGAPGPLQSTPFKVRVFLSVADHGPRDQSGRPEEPQIFVDCCYFLLPVCDRKRSTSAVTLHQTVREAIPSAIHNPALPTTPPGVSSQQVMQPPTPPSVPSSHQRSVTKCFSRRQAEDGASIVELPHFAFRGLDENPPCEFRVIKRAEEEGPMAAALTPPPAASHSVELGAARDGRAAAARCVYMLHPCVRTGCC